MRVPLTILTGARGAGKTTLLNSWLAHPEASRTAVLVSEIGHVALERHLPAVHSADPPESAGCLCCRPRTDLADALIDLIHSRRLEEEPAFDRVILETSTTAPQSIVQSLISSSVLAASFDLHRIIAMIDASGAEQALVGHGITTQQIAAADYVLVSGTHALPIDIRAQRVARIEQRVRQINRSAAIMTSVDPALTAQQLLRAS